MVQNENECSLSLFLLTKHSIRIMITICFSESADFVFLLFQLQTCRRRASHYLSAGLRFLLTNLGIDLNDYSANVTAVAVGENETAVLSLMQHNVLERSSNPVLAAIELGYYLVLSDEMLALEDRVAFACTYLPTAQLLCWLGVQRDHAAVSKRRVVGTEYNRGTAPSMVSTSFARTGGGGVSSASSAMNSRSSRYNTPLSPMSLENILITGMNDDGLQILQNYLDCSDDIQVSFTPCCVLFCTAAIQIELHGDELSKSFVLRCVALRSE